MKVILSLGYGRLHLVSSAEWLAKAGASIKLICGWVPRKANGWLVRLCSKIIGRDLSKGMAKRAINIPGVTTCSMVLADFYDQGLRLFNRILFRGKYHAKVSRMGWKMFGWMSRRHLTRDCEIFHVRSGAGQGGAIRKAKRLGMKVVVDHSIAHPAFMDRQLRSEYEKNGARFDLGMDSVFWQQVVKDCEEADVVMVNSFFVRDTFLEQGFSPEKVKVVYLGEREDFFGLRKPREIKEGEPLRLLFTGGFGFRKGAEYILESLKMLKERGVKFTMDVVGDYGGAKGMIAKFEKDIDISYGAAPEKRSDASIVFYGPKPQDELKSFLANSDIYVFPSLAEGCAQSGMEAMSAGICVVGTHESGFPITDGENGYIVPSKNAAAIADKVEWLSKNPDAINRTGANAAKLIAENYTWPKYAENVMNLYKELSDGK